MLSDKFIEKYKTIQPPFGGNGLGKFVYLRTYARWLEEENRREEWYETVRRVTDYSISLYNDKLDHTAEAEELYDLMFNLKLFPAGRTMWIGGTEAVKKFPMANYNCSFRVVDSLDAFSEVFYLLMLGCGTGFRILPEDVTNIPFLRADVRLQFDSQKWSISGYSNDGHLESTSVYKENGTFEIIVGDSKEGWVNALKYYLLALSSGDYRTIIINTGYVRAKGAILKTFGGRASGPEGLVQMFEDIHKVVTECPQAFWKDRTATEIKEEIEQRWIQLRPIDALDIMNIIAYNVVVGGVRRSSQIALFAHDDEEVLNAKLGLYTLGSPNYGKNWRAMSNNSIYFTEKPEREELVNIFDRIQHNGEPGFVNATAASLRRPNFNGINPCAEILLDNRGLCNLCEINLTAFIVPTHSWVPSGYALDFRALENAIRHAVRMGLRITTVDLELPEWDKIQKRDRLIGISLSGIVDTEDIIGTIDLESIRSWANHYATRYAKEMRIPAPLLVTTIKPSGTISQLPTISSGVHRSFAREYIRRVRVTASDPIARVMRDLGYPVYPETGMGPLPKDFDKLDFGMQNEVLANANTWVVEFPVQTAAKMKAADESAIIQFNRYLGMQKRYTDHNTSITIYFKDAEKDVLIDTILDNWDNYIAVSFLPTDGNTYNLMPYEAISEIEYHKRNRYLEPERINELLIKYETTEDAIDESLDPSCATGVCAPR